MLRSLVLVLLLGPVLGLSGCASGPDTDLDGVVLIVVDTLRADRLGAWGHASATTPNVDALAARGLVFEDATTPVPVTLPAFASLLTGERPTTHGIRDNDGFVLDDAAITLTERFAQAGWRTGAFVGAAVIEADRGLAQGFDVYDDDFAGDPFPVYRPDLEPLAESLGATRRRAPEVNARALRWVREGDGPFFLMVHYFDVHSPYDPPPRFAQRHPGQPYDGAIAATDHAIGELLAGLPANTLVVFVADHGEGLGEHGESEHGFLLYQSTLHVPMIVAGPRVAAGRVDTPVGLVDVAPTIAAYVGLDPLPAPEGIVLPLDGSAVPARAGIYAETLRPLISYGWQELRAWREGARKAIAGRHALELYDLGEDPHELDDLAATAADTTAFRRALDSVVDDEDAESVRRDAMRRMQDEPERAEMLASLGYVSGGDDAPAADRPHPREALPRWMQRQRDKVRARMAAAWVREGRFEDALVTVDSLLVDQPDRADLLYTRSRALFALGDSTNARDALAASLRSDPVFVPSMRLQAEQLIRQRAFRPAIDVLARLVRVVPDDFDAQYNLGVAYLQVGEPAQARRWLQSFVDARPQDRRAASVRQWLGQGN